MDNLILTFNKEQLKTYNELSKKDYIEFCFDTELPKIEKIFVCDFDEIIPNIEKEALMLLSFNKHSSSFSAFLNQEEIKKFIPIYYNSIREIRRHSSIIDGEVFKISFKTGEINKAIADMNKRYSDFLPYKAALYKRDEYADKINEIDAQFKNNIESLDILKKELLSLMQRAEKITSIVSNFIKTTSKATDEPKFKSFDAYDFFWAVEALIEQIRNI